MCRIVLCYLWLKTRDKKKYLVITLMCFISYLLFFIRSKGQNNTLHRFNVLHFVLLFIIRFTWKNDISHLMCLELCSCLSFGKHEVLCIMLFIILTKWQKNILYLMRFISSCSPLFIEFSGQRNIWPSNVSICVP